MEVVLAAISAGGLVGASNQYLCLLLIALATRWGWFDLGPRVEFMTSIWFIGFVWWGLFGVAALLPILLIIYLPLSLLLFTLIGVFSARVLLRTFDIPEADLPLEGMPSLGTV